MKNLDPKVKELIEAVKKLINEIEGQQYKSSIDFNAFDVTGYAGQEYGGFPEPVMKMEDEF